MKTTVIILSAIGLLSLNSCQQETDPQALMKNSETRTEVFNVITENQDYSEFMNNMLAYHLLFLKSTYLCEK